MSSTPCREQILEAVQTALGAVPVAGLTVSLDRDEAPTESEMPHLAVYDQGEEDTPDWCGEDGKALAVLVEGYATGAEDADAKAALAGLRAGTLAAMAGLQASSGLPLRLVEAEPEGPAPLVALDAAGPVRVFSRSWRIEYATAEGDPMTWA